MTEKNSELGFWGKLRRPVFVLAPMVDVTDCAFRQIINKYGKPDVFWTEFVSADGLAHPEAREELMVDLEYSAGEHPIVAQIFGGNAENMKIAVIFFNMTNCLQENFVFIKAAIGYRHINSW